MILNRFVPSSNCLAPIHALFFWLCALVLCGDSPGQKPTDELIQTRMRISWGGGVDEVWAGNIHFHDAVISKATPLGMNVESAAAIQVQPHAVRIKQLVESSFEGVDIDVEGHPDSLVTFQMAAPAKPAVEQQFKLSEAIQQARVFRLDDTNNRISFERSAGDQIKIESDREHMVFATGETFEFQLGANLVPGSGSGTQCVIETVRVDSAETIAQTTIALPCNSAGSSQLLRQVIAVPPDEGVYEFKFSLINGEDSGGLLPGLKSGRQPLVSRKRLVTRVIQVVVLDRKPFVNQSAEPWDSVVELIPSDLRQTISPSVHQLTQLVGVSNKLTSIGKYSIQDQPNPAVVLPPSGWQAITLKIDDPDTKHLVEIEYDSHQSMALGCSIIAQQENYGASNFGFDSGFSVNDSVAESTDSNRAVHRMTFWPDSDRVVLLLANRDSKKSAQFKQIRLLRRQSRGQSNRSVKQDSATMDKIVDRRRMMVLYEQPLFAENFGVSGRLDDSTQQPVADWSTFYRGAKRLISQLHEINANGAFINVLGEGSSLVPLESTTSSPRYDTGVFSSRVNGIHKKDVVELLYRMFERENLRLVPTLTFDHPISQLEFNAPADSKLIDYRKIERHAVEYELPRYNPLSLAVQAQVNAIVEEIVDRYKHREGYEGIALACRPDTCTLLPGSRIAGYDDETIARFQKESGISDPVLTGSDLLSPKYAQKWLAWRSSQMTKWYEQIARISSLGGRKAKCYLATVDISRNEEFASILSPALHHSPDFALAMQRMGLASGLSTRRNGIVLMRPYRHAPLHSLASQKSEFELQNVSQFAQWFSGQNQSASLMYARSAWARFENLEKSSLLNRVGEPILRLQQLSRSEEWDCQPLAQALLENDTSLFVDGGLLMNSSVNEHRKNFVGVFSQLSNENFDNAKHSTHPDERHPVAVRYLNRSNGTELYLVNSSPWRVEVTVQTNKALAGGIENFSQRDWLPVGASESPGEFRVTLEPFELIGGRVPNKQVVLREFIYRLPDSAQRQLSASYYKLRSKLVASGNAQPLDLLGNPGFEKPSLEDWTIGNQVGNFAIVDSNDDVLAGQSALRIDNRDSQNVWIRSDVIPVPETGRLSISVWLKLGKDQQQPPLRISVESDDPKTDYYRFAEVGSLQSESVASNQLTSDWRQFAVHFDDLPQQPISGLRIGFDMIGTGEVWVDKVQIYDRWLDENDAKAITQMLASIGPLLNEAETLERCRRILESYWPTFLREYFEDQSSVAQSPEDTPGEPVAEFQDKPVRSTMRQRFRRFVSPGIFQFR